MRPRAARVGATGAAAALIAAAGPLPAFAQSQDTLYYRNGAEQVALEVSLNRLGALAAPHANESTLVAYLNGLGFGVVQNLGPGLYAGELPAPLANAQDVFDSGRALYLNRPDLFENGGPIAHFLGTNEAVVLTDQFIVLYHKNARDVDIDSLVTAWRVELLITAPTEPELRLYRVTPGSPGGVMEATAAFQASPLARWAYPDLLDLDEPAGPRRVGPAAVEPDPTAPAAVDPLVGLQWHLENSAGADIGATAAWVVTAGNPNVVIAVLESGGFDVGHPDLKEKLWKNMAEISGDAGGVVNDDDDGNGYKDDYNGYNFHPCVNATACALSGNNDLRSFTQTHGTAVAGLAAADGTNGEGVSGVCPGCSLMLLPTGGKFGKELAFRYAQANGANVISASWQMIRNTPLENIVRDVANGSNGYKGIPIIWSIGNGPEDRCVDNGGQLRQFGSMPEVFSVGGSNDQDKRVATSNTGDCLDLLAPGGFGTSDTGITTTDARGSDGYNPGTCARGELTTSQDYTNCFGGTSAAAPIVSGVVGLMLSANPTLTTTQVYDILRRTAVKIDCAAANYGNVGGTTCPTNPDLRSDTHGYGRVDALAAVQQAKQTLQQASGASGGSGVSVVPVAGPSGEMGARAGWTSLTGASAGQDRDVTNAPGGGPGGEPVFHVAWFTSAPGASARWMWEVQVGHSKTSLSSPPSEASNTVLAIQPAYLYNVNGLSLYAGPNLSLQRTQAGGSAASTSQAFGGAVGVRYPLWSRLAVRLEARFRSWTNGGPDEAGVSAGFGVLIP